jgi:hypothetical protein
MPLPADTPRPIWNWAQQDWSCWTKKRALKLSDLCEVPAEPEIIEAWFEYQPDAEDWTPIGHPADQCEDF